MVEAEFLAFIGDDFQNNARQVNGVGGRAHLVPDDAQLVALAAQAQHGFHEVAGKLGVEPAGAQDEVPAGEGRNHLLALQLGEAINAQRGGGVGLGQGRVAGAGKHEIGGNLDEHGVELAAEARQVFHPVAVDAAGQVGLVLGFVHGGVGGAVHHVGRAVLAK